MKTVLFIGPSPDRIGGVSTHIYRLSKLLSEEYSFDYIDEGRGKKPEYFNMRSLNLLRYIKKIRQADIVHIHSGVFILRLINVLFAKLLLRKRVIVSVHHDLKVEGHIEITRSLLKKCDCAILDSQDIYDSVYLNNSNCRYRMMPAFLPPVESDEEQLPDSIESWIEKVRKEKDSVLMCSSSSNIVDYNGVDLYGNDMSINAIRILNERKVGKVFYLIMIVHNSAKCPEKLKFYKKMIANGLSKNILLVTSSVSFIRVMKESDVVLRPTNTDGDSITIRESLYYLKPTVASDCTFRPNGTIVFKTRDIEDYCEKILSSINDNGIQKINPIDYKAFYKECYEKNSGIRK